jgi:hypothetical protein
MQATKAFLRWLYSRQHSACSAPSSHGLLPDILPKATLARRAVPAHNKFHPTSQNLSLQLCADCRTQNSPRKPAGEHPTLRAFCIYPLSLRFEDTVKPPEIDDQILGKFGFTPIGLSQRRLLQGTFFLSCSSEMFFWGPVLFQEFSLQARSFPPHFLHGQANLLDWTDITTPPLTAGINILGSCIKPSN